MAVALCFALFALSPAQTLGQDTSPTLNPTPTATFVVIGVIRTSQGINLRAGASTGDEVVAVLPPGTSLVVLDASDDGTWQHVRLSDGTEGWVSSTLLVVVGTVTPTPYPSATPLPKANADAFALAEQPVTSNSQWSPVMKTFNGVDMVLVPAGCYIMGTEGGERDESPVSQQCFERPFWMDRTEVTNQQFRDLGGRVGKADNFPNEDQFPRETISWREARNFCRERGGYLPTEAQWEYAARGPDDLIYPWGNDFAAENVIYVDNSQLSPADVASRPAGASWVGALDMSGNASEWVRSVYDDGLYPYPYRSDDGREEDIGDLAGIHAVRGGSWGNSADGVRTAARIGVYGENRYNDIGFRCARDYEG
jgi:formylglycine-generating enzyme required for sulfatase activity